MHRHRHPERDRARFDILLDIFQRRSLISAHDRTDRPADRRELFLVRPSMEILLQLSDRLDTGLFATDRLVKNAARAVPRRMFGDSQTVLMPLIVVTMYFGSVLDPRHFRRIFDRVFVAAPLHVGIEIAIFNRSGNFLLGHKISPRILNGHTLQI